MNMYLSPWKEKMGGVINVDKGNIYIREILGKTHDGFSNCAAIVYKTKRSSLWISSTLFTPNKLYKSQQNAIKYADKILQEHEFILINSLEKFNKLKILI